MPPFGKLFPKTKKKPPPKKKKVEAGPVGNFAKTIERPKELRSEQHAEADDVLLALSHACRMRRSHDCAEGDAVVESTLAHAVSDLPKLRAALESAGWEVARVGAIEQGDARVTFH